MGPLYNLIPSPEAQSKAQAQAGSAGVEDLLVVGDFTPSLFPNTPPAVAPAQIRAQVSATVHVPGT